MQVIFCEFFKKAGVPRKMRGTPVLYRTMGSCGLQPTLKVAVDPQPLVDDDVQTEIRALRQRGA